MIFLSPLLLILSPTSSVPIRGMVPSIGESALYRNRKICNRDIIAVQRRLKKRYVLNEHRWSPGTLSWSFRDPFHLFKNDQHFVIVKNILWEAFEKWSKSSEGALMFKDRSPSNRTARSSGRGTDFDILFAKFAHGDKESFDGAGGIVAHSGYPMEGIIHFDGSEFWSVNGHRGIDLRYVALHEIGHALGLRHSEDPKAVMNPYYSEQLKDGFRLGRDDVLGIRKLYGPRSSTDEAVKSSIAFWL